MWAVLAARSGRVDVEGPLLGRNHAPLDDRGRPRRPRRTPRSGRRERRPGTNTGPSSSETPYVVRTVPGVVTTSILTVGDRAPNGYRLVGLADGLGAFDNGDGTFTLLVDHELGAHASLVRAHGSTGAFVSRWTVDSETLEVLDGRRPRSSGCSSPPRRRLGAGPGRDVAALLGGPARRWAPSTTRPPVRARSNGSCSTARRTPSRPLRACARARRRRAGRRNQLRAQRLRAPGVGEPGHPAAAGRPSTVVVATER